MPNAREHNRSCQKLGIPTVTCKDENTWMDEPSQSHPGCAHRKYRHSLLERLARARAVTQESYQECKKKNGETALLCVAMSVKKGVNSFKATIDHVKRDEVENKKKGTCGC